MEGKIRQSGVVLSQLLGNSAVETGHLAALKRLMRIGDQCFSLKQWFATVLILGHKCRILCHLFACQ